MYVVIDFDGREIMCVHSNKKVLDQFISKEGLEMAVAIVDSADELVLQFSLRELNELAENLNVGRNYDDEEDAGMGIWNHISSDFGEYPTYVKGKFSQKQVDDKPEEESIRKPKQKSSKPKAGGKRPKLEDKSFQLGDTDAKRTTAKGILRTVIEEGLGEASYQDLISELEFQLDYDEKKSIGYIRSAIGKDMIRIFEEL